MKKILINTANLIDEEVRTIIDRNYDRAKTLLEEHKEKLEKMAMALMKYETLNHSQIKDIMEGREVQPPEDWDDSDRPKKPSGKAKAKQEPPKPIGGTAIEH